MTITERIRQIYTRIQSIKTNINAMPSYARLLNHDMFNFYDPTFTRLYLERDIGAHINVTWIKTPITTMANDKGFKTTRTEAYMFIGSNVTFKSTFLAGDPLRLDVIAYLEAYLKISPFMLMWRVASFENHHGLYAINGISRMSHSWDTSHKGFGMPFPSPPVGIQGTNRTRMASNADQLIADYLNAPMSITTVNKNGLEGKTDLNYGLAYYIFHIWTNGIPAYLKAIMALHP